MEHLWPVILAGGVGSRFWPLSRASRPKQLLDLFGQGPMLQVTSRRIEPLAPLEHQIIVTNDSLLEPIRALLPGLPAENLLGEPRGRNTAPAIAWAALCISRRDPDAILAVLPADHHIADEEAFRAASLDAASLAAEGWILTLGVTPTRPETGYGYIRRGEALGERAARVESFKEKPDLETALAYLGEGGYLWNAGIFFMPARLLLDELRSFEPALMAQLDRLEVAGGAPPALVAEAYDKIDPISVDHAVMERSRRIAVIGASFGWSDVGSWRSLWDFRPEGAGTFTRGRVLEVDGGDNVLVSEGGVVATVGVRDLIVVHTPEATLVCPRDQAQRVRELVAALDEEPL